MKNIYLYFTILIGIGYFLNKKSYIKLLKTNIAKEMILSNKFSHILDVRSVEEFTIGHYPNSINIPFDTINEYTIGNLNKLKPILIYCRSGRRAKIAADKLVTFGFRKIYYINDTYKSLL